MTFHECLCVGSASEVQFSHRKEIRIFSFHFNGLKCESPPRDFFFLVKQISSSYDSCGPATLPCPGVTVSIRDPEGGLEKSEDSRPWSRAQSRSMATTQMGSWAPAQGQQGGSCPCRSIPSIFVPGKKVPTRLP